MSAQNPAITVAVNRHGAPNGASRPETSPTPESASPAQNEDRVYHTPPIDIHEGPEGLILEADLPGVAETDLTIHLEDNVLSLNARVAPPLSGDGRLLHEEYRISDYYRSFILSDEVERDQIRAELKNGVLRLTLPRAERSKTRRIEIRS